MILNIDLIHIYWNFFEKNKGRFRSNSPPRGKSDGNYLTKKHILNQS